MRIKLNLVFFFWFVLNLLVGCADSLTATPISTAPALAALSPTLNLPSQTPSLTPTFTRTPRPTGTPTATLEPLTATPNYAATVIVRKTPQPPDLFVSPNGNFEARVDMRPCVDPLDEQDIGYDELRIKSTKSGQEVVADTQVQFCGGLGAAGLLGFFWSSNSRCFYYTDARQGVPDGCGYWHPPTIVYDTQTNTTTHLGIGTYSPDRTRLAVWHYDRLYATDANTSILIWDLNNGEIAQHKIDVEQVVEGPIAWSPDGQSLVFLRTTSWCPTEDSFLTRLDAPAYQPAFEQKLGYGNFDGVAWELPDELRLWDWGSVRWRFDLTTLKLAPYPLAPQPTLSSGRRFSSEQYNFSFSYPSDWDADCCRIGAAPETAEYQITVADPATGRAGTDAPLNILAVFVDTKPKNISFESYIETEKKRLRARRQEPSSFELINHVNVGGHDGTALRGFLSYPQTSIYLPLKDDYILVLIASLNQKSKWDTTLTQIFQSFVFE